MIIHKMPEGYKLYTKRPIPIKAIQIKEPFQVNTMEGVLAGKEDDYLIEGVEGELYPCDRKVFIKTYKEFDNGD